MKHPTYQECVKGLLTFSLCGLLCFLGCTPPSHPQREIAQDATPKATVPAKIEDQFKSEDSYVRSTTGQTPANSTKNPKLAFEHLYDDAARQIAKLSYRAVSSDHQRADFNIVNLTIYAIREIEIVCVANTLEPRFNTSRLYVDKIEARGKKSWRQNMGLPASEYSCKIVRVLVVYK
jgi:hypothetical protein